MNPLLRQPSGATTITNDAQRATRAANSAVAPYGYMVTDVAWGSTPLKVTLRRATVVRWGAQRISAPAVGGGRFIVDEPYPEFFPSEVFLQRVMVLA